jgi:hypothetical protein
MVGMGEFTFAGYMVQKANNVMLVFVPDNIPDEEHEKLPVEGVFLKAILQDRTFIGGAGEEGLVRGKMIYGEGRLTLSEDKIPEVLLKTLLVFWRIAEDIALPPFLLETFLAEVGVTSHLRKLPKGMNASKKQVLLAAKEGIILPKGYTYVSEHVRKQEKTQQQKPQEHS